MRIFSRTRGLFKKSSEQVKLEMVSVISQRSSLTNLAFSDQSMMKKININTLTQCLKQLHQFEEILCTSSSIEDLSQHNALKDEHLSLLKSTMELVQCLRTDHWNNSDICKGTNAISGITNKYKFRGNNL